MMKAVIVLLFATAAFGFRLGDGGKVNIDFIVDRQLKYFVDPLLNSTYPIPDFTGPDASGTGVSVSGVNTLVRKGDNLVWADSATNTIGSQGSFGLASMVIHVDAFTMAGQTGKTDISIADNELYFQVTTTVGDSSCSVSFDDIHVVSATGVTTSSDNPALDGLDLSDMAADTVIPYINDQIKTPAIQKQLHDLLDPCTKSL